MINNTIHIVSAPCYLCESTEPIPFNSFVVIRSESLIISVLRKKIAAITRNIRYQIGFSTSMKKINLSCDRIITQNRSALKTVLKLRLTSLREILKLVSAANTVKSISVSAIRNIFHNAKTDNISIDKKAVMTVKLHILPHLLVEKKLFISPVINEFTSIAGMEETKLKLTSVSLANESFDRSILCSNKLKVSACANEIFYKKPEKAEISISAHVTASVWEPIFLDMVYPIKLNEWYQKSVSDVFLGKKIM